LPGSATILFNIVLEVKLRAVVQQNEATPIKIGGDTTIFADDMILFIEKST
jgi:hypothetical protein